VSAAKTAHERAISPLPRASGGEGQGEGAPAPPAGRARPPPWQLAIFAWTTLVFLLWAVLPFVAAGTLRWTAGWAHHVTLLLGLFLHGRHVARASPALRARRRAIGEGTKRWDIAWNVLFWPFMAAIAVTAGLDFRGRGPTLPAWLWPAGAAILAAGLALSARAMVANPFFESTARIQREAGHRVIDAGPYRLVRHPGYLGLVLWAAASPFLLLSSRALGAAAAAVAWIALRTALEDSMLRRELDGYEAYAGRVRYRVVPGVW
jgi:protein-S-isoprenylcysteine O-methyltransferase Ste14